MWRAGVQTVEQGLNSHSSVLASKFLWRFASSPSTAEPTVRAQAQSKQDFLPPNTAHRTEFVSFCCYCTHVATCVRAYVPVPACLRAFATDPAESRSLQLT